MTPPRARPPRPLPSRYDVLEIARRVERMRLDLGVEIKAVCAMTGMGKDEWSRKVRAVRSTFSVVELGTLAELWGCPVGWPFVDADRGRMLEALESQAIRGVGRPGASAPGSAARTHRK